MAERKTRNAAATTADALGLLDDLRESLIEEMERRLQSMMQVADNALFELARSSPPTQLPGFLNARHLLRSEEYREALASNFRDALLRRLRPGADHKAADKLELRDNEEVEDGIQITEMAQRVGSHCEAQLQDLSGRFELLRELVPNFPSVASLTPMGICEAFSSAVNTLPDGVAARGALNRLFEKTVLDQLRPIYLEAVAACERHGIRASAPRPTPRSGPRPPADSMGGSTATMLQKVQSGQAPRLKDDPEADPSTFLPDFSGGFSDSDLAQLLLQALQGQVAGGFDLPKMRLLKQRAGLVGRMFDDILDDPQIPERLHPAIEAFRFPAIKAALADAAFFTDKQHPVRSLINDMAGMAGDTRIGGTDALRRFDGWARRVLRQADLAAQEVRARLAETRPLPPTEVEAFLLDQGQQQQERHKSLLRKVRETVDQELELCTATSELPEPVWPLLRTGWGPMMASHLLRQGPESQLYRSGMELLHRVLFALNPESPNARTPAERVALRVDLFKALTTVGMPRERANELLLGLDQALDSFNRKDVPGTGAAQAAMDRHPPAAEWEVMSATMEITLRPSSSNSKRHPPAQPSEPAAKELAPLEATAKIPMVKVTSEEAAEAEAAVTAEKKAEAAAVAAKAAEPAAVAPPQAAPREKPAPVAAKVEPPAAVVAAAPAEPVAAARKKVDLDATVALNELLAEAHVTAQVAAAAAEPEAPKAPAPTRPKPVDLDSTIALDELLTEALNAPLSQPENAATPEEAAVPIVCLPLELPTPPRFVEQLLQIGAWFRVYDRRSQGTRWLKLNSWFPQVKRASFTEFDGHNGITVTAAELLEDLLEGRSEPIDIPPQQVMILQALRQKHAESKATDASGESQSSMVA